ncbi:hypothetical protein ACQKB0_18575 [Mycobacterium tuberculosis]
MEARTDAKLRLAELAATLRNGTRLLTLSLLTDYRTREATKQAQTLTSALLRRLSTCPPSRARQPKAFQELVSRTHRRW